MDPEFLQKYGLLAVGFGILVLAIFTLLVQLSKRTAAGQLHQRRRELREGLNELRQARREHARTEAELKKLQVKAKRVKPRRLQQAREDHQDSTALLRQAQEKVKVSGYHIRQIILHEYAPQKQERLLKKYLPKSDGTRLPPRL